MDGKHLRNGNPLQLFQINNSPCRYRNCFGGVRTGKMLGDLDALAVRAQLLQSVKASPVYRSCSRFSCYSLVCFSSLSLNVKELQDFQCRIGEVLCILYKKSALIQPGTNGKRSHRDRGEHALRSSNWSLRPTTGRRLL